MAKSDIKKIVTIMVITIVAFAQADDSPLNGVPTPDVSSPDVPSPHTSHVRIGTIICLGKCALRCKHFLKFKPLYFGCIALCGLKCHKISSKVAYECTTDCVFSMSINGNTGIHTFILFFLFSL